MTEATKPSTNFLYLASSFVLGAFAVLLCFLARTIFMNTPADWFTFDYTRTGWVIRLFAVIFGFNALFFVLLARRGSHKRNLRRFVYRIDVAVALIGAAYEIAIPALLLFLIIHLIGDAVTSSIDSRTIGCLGGCFDFFDLFDLDD